MQFVPGSAGWGLGLGFGSSCFLFMSNDPSRVIVSVADEISVTGLALHYISIGIIMFTHLRILDCFSCYSCASLMMSKPSFGAPSTPTCITKQLLLETGSTFMRISAVVEHSG